MEIDFLCIGITGNKFLRAMEIIDELDPESRAIKHSQCIVVYVQDLLRKQNLI